MATTKNHPPDEGDLTISTSEPLDEIFQFRALMENTEDSIYFKDRECRLLHVSRRMAESLGFSDVSELVGKTDIDLFGESFGQRTMLEDLRIMASNEPIVGLVESRQIGPSETNWTLTTKVPLHDASGEVIGLLGITREINELKRTELNLQHLATHDSLTGLPNRYLMTDRLNQILVHSARTGATFAVLFVDVDDFKAINDLDGHEFGDLVLRTIGERLVGAVRGTDTVARIGGDEFVIILEPIRRREDAGVVAEKILRSVVQPIALRRRKARVTVSIGISIHPDSGSDAEVLVRAADYAMYQAKGNGKNGWLFCPIDLPGGGESPQPMG